MLEVGVLVVAASLNLLVGLLVYVKNQQAAMNRYFLGLTSVLSLWSIANYLSTHPVFFSQLYLVRFVLFCAALLNLMVMLTFLAFPAANIPEKYRSRVKWSVGLSVVIAFLMLTPIAFRSLRVVNGHTSPEVEPGIVLLLLQTLILLGGSVIGIIRRLRTARGKAKDQLHLVLLGLAGTFGLILISNFLLVVLFNVSALVPLGPAFTLVFSFSFAYAIIKHQLFNIRRAAARGFAYLLTIGLLALVYSILLFILSAYIFKNKQALDTETQVIFTVLALLMALSFQNIRQFFDKLSAKIFFKDAYNPQELLDELNQIIVSTVSLESMLKKTLQLIQESLKAEFCLAVLTIPGTHKNRIIGTVPKTFSPQDMAAVHSKAVTGRSMAQITVTDTLDDRDNTLREILIENDIALLARIGGDLSGREKQLGHIIIGSKRNGNSYDSQDMRLIAIFTNELVIAIQNALRFEEIQNFNLTLQEKVQQATKELRHTNERLKDLDDTKDDFISMASHQLRTPLTSVKGYLSLVLEGDAGKINATQQKMLTQAFTSSQRMVYLIADLLNVSRLKTGKFVIEPVRTNLADVISDEIEQLKEQAASRQVTLEYAKPAGFPELMLDETKTRQVIMNFIDNAIYYTPAGGHIQVTLTDKDGMVELRVKDDGIGVPKAEQHHLFTKFYRAGNARKARPDGTGLGLFMAKKVIAAQGGSLVFESQEGKGSTFGFTFSKSRLLPEASQPQT